MKIRRRGPLCLAILAVAVALPLAVSRYEQAALGKQGEPTPAAVEALEANAMAVDAIPGGPIDASRTVDGSEPFEVNIVITHASIPYESSQYGLEWDPAVLAFDSEMALHPSGPAGCLKARPERSKVWGACARGGETARFVGPVNTVRLHCVSDGESPLHLITAAEDTIYTTTLNIHGQAIDTTLTDTLIACRNVGPPAPTPVPPANDSFSEAKVVAGLPFHDSAGTAGATREPLEPDPCDMGNATLWYRFTPDVTQFVQAETLGSDFDTVIGVYTGATLASLTPVACNDDADGLQSKVVAQLEGGRTYYFQVGGFTGYRGLLVFDLGTTAAPAPPAPTMPNALAVDTSPGGGIESTRTVTGIDSFQLDIYVTSASQPYQGYEYVLQWDPAVLRYDGQSNLSATGFGLCATPATTGNTVAVGCIRAAGPAQVVGPVSTVTLHCIADGLSPLHLAGLSDPHSLLSTTLGPMGDQISTALTDAVVTCQGTGREAAPGLTPTPLPVAPVTGSGGFLREP